MIEQQVAVLGLGYVGCVSAACLAALGHCVVGADRDEFKVKSVNEGRAPFHEPGLDELITEAFAAGRLRATMSVADALDRASLAFICVGTPSDKNSNIGLDQLRRVVADIRDGLAGRPSERPLIVAVRSTVYPGTCEEVVISALGGLPAIVVDHPEFLREGNAIRDFMKPSLILVGGDRAAAETVAAVYEPLGVPACLVGLRTAEMTKYVCNAFHALKVAFANEIGALCKPMGIPAAEVMETFAKDTVLNISAAYLKPGFAFGGSCLPKDLRALVYRASRLDLELPLLKSVLPSNAEHLRRSIRDVMELRAERLGVFGLSFKENTDDLRESSVVELLEHLIGKGRNVRVFDPQVRLDKIYGVNQRFIMTAIPHIAALLDVDFDSLGRWADHLVIAQKPSPEFAKRIRLTGLPVLDLTGTAP
jgi:GDP-mannose 6-dehydrogenase